MEWQHDPADNAYTLMREDVRCRVWFTSMGNWAAVVVQKGMSSAAYNFKTAEDAKAWCNEQVTKADRRT